jgi:hypothetical protein
MTKDEKIAKLKQAFEDTIWMAIRYAHGRHTYAPGIVRNAITTFKKVFPDWNPRNDITIDSPDKDTIKGALSRSDYLDDLFKDE